MCGARCAAQDVWLDCSKKLQKCASEEGDFSLIFSKLTGRLEEDEVQLFAVVARQIWFQRNAVVFGGDMISPAVVIQRARNQL